MTTIEPAEAPDTASASFDKLSSCPLCTSERIAHWLDGYDPHYGNKGTFPVWRCNDCGLKFLNPMPTPEFLSCAYPDDYYSYQPAQPNRLKTLLASLLGYNSRATGDPKFSSPGCMVDVGCGSGEFLLKMRARGWQVEGVEMSKVAAEAGRRLYGLNIFGGTLPEARLPSAAFDYVRLNHSFEHITNPRKVLGEIKRILKPDGRLFIGVPNGDGLAARIAGKYWWNLGPPVHPFTYNPRTLGKLLEESGFVIERLAYNSNFAGLNGSFQIYLNRKNGRPSHVGWAMGIFPLKLAGQWASKLLDALRQGDCIEMTAQLARAPHA